MKTELQKLLKKWVADNFGAQEAQDPCYDLGALAEHLEKNFSRLYEKFGQEYIKGGAKE